MAKVVNVVTAMQKVVAEQLTLLSKRSAEGAMLDYKDVELLAKLLDTHLLLEKATDSRALARTRGSKLSTEELEDYAEDT